MARLIIFLLLVSGLVGCAPSSPSANGPACLPPSSAEPRFVVPDGAVDLSPLIDMPVPESMEELLEATELIVVGRATEALEVSTVMTGPSEFPSDTPGFKRLRSSYVTYTVRFELEEIITGATPCTDIGLSEPLGPFMDSGTRELLFLAVDPRSGRYYPVGGPWTGRWLVDDDGMIRSLYGPSTGWWFAGVIDGQPIDAVRKRLG